MILLSLIASAAGAAPFRVYQYALPYASGEVLGCKPQPLESVPFADYAHNRWVAPAGVKMIGTDCAAPAGDLLLAKSGIALAAVRFTDEPPRQAILDLSPKSPPSVAGWPAPPPKRSGLWAQRPAPRGANLNLRMAVVCWPEVNAWPVPENRDGRDALPRLEPKNPCEWWLLPFKTAGGELKPDLDGRSYLIVPNSKDETSGRFRARQDWPELFTADADVSVQDALENGWDKAPMANEQQLHASQDAMAAGARKFADEPQRPQPTYRAAPAPAAAVASGPLPPCAPDVASTHEAVFARFSTWAEKFGVDQNKTPAWQASRWQGRCATYEVLRSALEERLGCKLDAEGCARQGEAAQ